jgi:hypothetical protein
VTNHLSAFSAGSKKVSWFDHFVGAQQDRWSARDTMRSGIGPYALQNATTIAENYRQLAGRPMDPNVDRFG